MKKKYLALPLASLLLLGSCSNKDAEQPTVRKPQYVKTLTLGGVTAETDRMLSATIEEESGTTLSFSSMGTLKSLNIKEGQTVKAGQFLGELDASTATNALDASKATAESARKTLAQAEDAYKRMKMLYDNGSLSEIKWVEAQTQLAQARSMVTSAEASEKIASKSVTDTRLIAPFTGYISNKQVEVGQNIAPSQPVAKLVKIDRVKVVFSVPEQDIANIKIGQKVKVNVGSLGAETFVATISEKGVSADVMSRQYEVKATIANPKHKLLPGMIGQVALSTDEAKAEDVLVLPANVIQIDANNQRFVWTVKDQKAKKTNIETGRNVGDNIIVSSGLRKGDVVIVEGQQKVSTGMAVTTTHQ